MFLSFCGMNGSSIESRARAGRPAACWGSIDGVRASAMMGGRGVLVMQLILIALSPLLGAVGGHLSARRKSRGGAGRPEAQRQDGFGN
jgi:hypothetical protein